MDQVTSLDKFRVPIGNQEIELQEVAFAAGGMPMLRLRIREHRRFTIFDMDAMTARHWAEAMRAWADQVEAAASKAAAATQAADGNNV